MLSREQHAYARAVFAAKYENTCRVANFRANRRRLLSEHRAELLQCSLLALWVACRQAAARGQDASAINCQVVVWTGAGLASRQRRRDRERLNGRKLVAIDATSDEDRPLEPAAPETSITTENITITLGDLRVDFPGLVEAFEAGDMPNGKEIAGALHQARQAALARMVARAEFS